MKNQNGQAYKSYYNVDNNILHAPYNPEVEFYSAIKLGNVNKTKEMCKEDFMNKPGLGKLSDNKLRNLCYHFVIATALMARYCIEGGMDLTSSFNLSDYYIKKADMCRTLKEISDLHFEMCVDYTMRMKNLRKKKICSKHIATCVDYIYENLNTRITLKTLAQLVNLDESYLSKLFKKEVGMTVSGFIQEKKIETAKNMLLYSEYSPAEISSILDFNNQSYFTEVFRKKTGMTPKRYQALNLRNIKLGE